MIFETDSEKSLQSPTSINGGIDILKPSEDRNNNNTFIENMIDQEEEDEEE